MFDYEQDDEFNSLDSPTEEDCTPTADGQCSQSWCQPLMHERVKHNAW